MPFILAESVPYGPGPPPGGLGAEQPPPKPLDVAGAAFRQFNTVVSGYNYLNSRAGLVPDPNYDPKTDPQVAGTDIERNHLDAVALSQSAAETSRIISGIRSDELDRQVLARSGWPGTVWAVGAGMLDPTIFAPIGEVYDLFKVGQSVLRAGASLGAVSAVQSMVQESVLAGTHPEVTAGEAAKSIASATILGGLLGSAIHYLSPAARVTAERLLDNDRLAWGNEVAGVPSTARTVLSIEPQTFRGPVTPALKIGNEVFIGDSHADALDKAIQQFGANSPELRAFNEAEKPLESIGVIRDRQFRPNVSGDEGASVLQASREAAAQAPPVEAPRVPIEGEAPAVPVEGVSPQAAAAGAAAADVRQLVLRPTFGLAEFINKTPGLRQLIGSPVTQTIISPFLSARRYMADLAETALPFTESLRGITPTKEGGPAVDRLARMLSDRDRYTAAEALDRTYAKYYTGQTDLGFTGQQVAKIKGLTAQLRGTPGRKMAVTEFRESVGRAMREGDISPIPEVQEAAQTLRRDVFDPWKDRAIRAGMLPEDVTPETALSYFMRVYNKDKINKTRPQFQQRLADWLWSEQGRKQQLQFEAERLRSTIEQADGILSDPESTPGDIAEAIRERDLAMQQIETAVTEWGGKSAWSGLKAIAKRDAEAAAKQAAGQEAKAANIEADILKAAQKMLASEQEFTKDELFSRAGEIVDRILGSPDGRLPYDAASGGPRIGYTGEQSRGPVAARQLMIPDKEIEDWLVSDAGEVTDRFLHTIVPDTLLTERFGDVEMTQAFKAMREDHEAQSLAATSEKQRDKLRKSYDNAVANMAAVRDRVRHVYGWSPEHNVQNLARLAQGLKRYNYITMGGQFALSSLSDIAGPITMAGLSKTLGSGYAPFLKSFTSAEGRAEWGAITKELKAAGIGIDTQLGARVHQWEDVVAQYRATSKFERVLGATSDTFGFATGISQWTDFGKNITGTVVMNNILEAIEHVAAGNATKKEIANLAESGIDAQMAGRIWENYSRGDGGAVLNNGVRLPNTGSWSDQGAKEAFQGAVSRETDIGIITPGQEKPLWMSRPMASLLGQFQSFTAAGTERLLLRGLAKRDFNIAQGVLFATAAGMLSSAITGYLNGTDMSNRRPMDWVKEGMSRGGILGWLEQGNGIAAKMTSGRADLYRLIGADRPLTRFQSRSVLGALLGPTADKIDALSNVTGAAARGDWTSTDTRRVRRLFGFQNMVGLNKVFDLGETGVNRMLGVQ